MKKFFALTSLMTLSIFADTAPSQAQIQVQNTPAQNTQARFGTRHRGNFYASGEGIWFKPIQAIPSYTKGTAVTGDNQVQNVKGSFFSHKFAPGFRVNAGYNTTYDGWDLSLTYTELNYKHNNSYIY